MALFFGITQFSHHQTPAFYDVGADSGLVTPDNSLSSRVVEPNLKTSGESVSEYCWYGCLDTVPGYIKTLGGYVDDPLPLCIDEEVVADWWMSVEVYGGYEPNCGYIDVWQKGVRVGKLFITWTEVREEAVCTPGIWNATFSIEAPFRLDSNQYPIVDENCRVIAEHRTIPGKDVCFESMTCWQGCSEDDQKFSIISTHALTVFVFNFHLPDVMPSVSYCGCTTLL